MTHLIDSLVSRDGLIAIVVLMTLESALIPVPSELVMSLAGFFAYEGHLSLVGAMVAGVVGNVVGSVVLWVIGRTGGRALVERFGRYVLLKPRDLDRAERWFAKHGESAVIVSRLLPVVRSVISLPAGVAEMRVGRFTLFTLIGSIPFVVALTLAGYFLGSSYETIVRIVQDFGYLAAVAIVLAVVAFVVARARARRRGAEAA
ncbi:SNARE associated Golgi protein [Acidimicrobium ferrooxidans DSM 10331]|uniref:SNARE associated Golgi protein n=1 Tax=Acidimicrobium ferrooxidans (strain DSM 10331 / JCM 15462 / NBRC 103882 / ICP) TaxID=525909 RepID=C7LY99_ACIFD|nr:DedA family protein [Acidimicrobium ferrooxidans]ACU53707.1 SNARE associated Golgi protein [Acidimicrobium ferrooxidans DSM 10331]